jgi:hypothetical protein
MKSSLLAGAAWATSVALGCSCGGLSVNQAKKDAEVVFRGTITDISAGKVVFRVDRVWKGNVGRTFDMPEFIEGAACLGFHGWMLKAGNDLLVYASRLHRSSDDEDYFTSICTRTNLSSDAGEDFKKLGKGKPPRP